MQFSLHYFDEVEIDVREAKNWYKEKRPGLENQFAESVKLTIQALVENPFIFAVRYKNIRIAHTKVFPYGIHFYIDEAKQQIVVIGVLHFKRSPKNALKRRMILD